MSIISIPARAKYSVRRVDNRWALIAKWDGNEYVTQYFGTRKAAMAARIL